MFMYFQWYMCVTFLVRTHMIFDIYFRFSIFFFFLRPVHILVLLVPGFVESYTCLDIPEMAIVYSVKKVHLLFFGSRSYCCQLRLYFLVVLKEFYTLRRIQDSKLKMKKFLKCMFSNERFQRSTSSSSVSEI